MKDFKNVIDWAEGTAIGVLLELLYSDTNIENLSGQSGCHKSI